MISPSFTVIKQFVPRVSLILFFHFVTRCFPLSAPLRPRGSRWACKEAFIERSINLQVTNSSLSGGCVCVWGGGCVRSGLLCCKTWTSKTSVPLSLLLRWHLTGPHNLTVWTQSKQDWKLRIVRENRLKVSARL